MPSMGARHVHIQVLVEKEQLSVLSCIMATVQVSLTFIFSNESNFNKTTWMAMQSSAWMTEFLF